MDEAAKSSLLLCERDLDEPQMVAFAGGHAAVFSHGSPAQESVNQDSAGVLAAGDESGILVIADGVGGLKSGQHASAEAVTSLLTRLSETGGANDLRSVILDGIDQANDRMLSQGTGATTMAVIEVRGNRVRPYHVGDSLILLCGPRGRLRWRSISHSPVGYAIEAGMIDEDDAMRHPDRHFVSNVVGCREMRIEIGPPLAMNPRDTLLLCSDGLSDNLSTDEIIETVRSGPLDAALRKLVQLATSRMKAFQLDTDHPSKPDDLTIIAYRCGRSGDRPEHGGGKI